jgi:carbamoyltransferase
MANIGFYGSHNSAIAVEQDGKIITVIELERFLGTKNVGLCQYKVPKHKSIKDFYDIIDSILEFIKKEYNITEFETCAYASSELVIDEFVYKVHERIPAKNHIAFTHHYSHAMGTFAQSPYEEALVFSFDGGGDDGKFNIYHCVRGQEAKLLLRVPLPNRLKETTGYWVDSGGIEHLHWIDYDLGFPYMVFGHYLDDIKFEPISEGNLVYSGKLMGLVSYGKVREEWIQHFIDFYNSNPSGPDYQEKIDVLGEKIGLKFDIQDRLKGQVAYDVAATSQKAFEECFLFIAKPFFEQYPDLPVCITGGCGLNIILNTRLVNEFNRDVFVGPTPNDCGLSVGLLACLTKPKSQFDVTYAGIPLMDKNLLNFYFNSTRLSNWWKDELDITEVATDLSEGKIVALAKGSSEHGPRALGNRSILCNPSIPDMKDILNKKVKHREWYRPFAPIVRLEDVNKYFEWNKEARWMSFCPVVKEEWREKLAAITHVDNTARVQTVTEEQNKFIYDLLTEFDKITGIGVLLNTSFNVQGMPILSTLNDAFTVFTESEIDTMIIENHYIRKYMKI